MKLAVIGNCAYQALIDDCARIKWLCWPRFDSSFVFGELLDERYGGEFSIAPADQEFTSAQAYLPLTNILRTEITSASGRFEVLDWAPRFKQYERMYKPTSLFRRVRPLDGKPMIRVRCRPVYDYGATVPIHYTSSNHIGWTLADAQLRLTTNAPLTYVSEGRPFALATDTYLALTWGRPLDADLLETAETYLARTRRYWKTWSQHANLPARYQDEVMRSALILKLHQFEDTGAITAATTTSLPEYPGSGRTWDYRYCWLRDSYFTLRALVQLGQFEEMDRFISYLINIASNYPERLQPVYAINGQAQLEERTLDHLAGYLDNGPVRAGNMAFEQQQHDVYGEMLAAIAPVFTDIRFRDRADAWHTDVLSQLLSHIEQHIESPDAGLWEKRQAPALHTFSLLMHWAGATAAQHVGLAQRSTELEDRGRELAERARELIESRCWRPKLGYYADTVDSAHTDASLFLMVNLGYLPGDSANAASHVDGLAKALSANDHLLYRYLHHDGIGDTHATFTVCGFWYAEALARIGRTDDAERVFTQLLSYANHAGLLSEDIDPQTGRLWGNIPQTYSHVGIINTAFALSPLSSPIL